MTFSQSVGAGGVVCLMGLGLLVPPDARAADLVGAETVKAHQEPDSSAFKVSAIKGSGGSVIGFHIEMVNTSATDACAIMAKKDIPFCRVRLKDKDGIDVTLALPALEKEVASEAREDYLFDTILPATSRSWFVPVPTEIVRGDGARVPIPKGQYKASIVIVASWTMQRKGPLAALEKPVYRLPDVAVSDTVIDVDPGALGNEDLVEAYLKNATTIIPPADADSKTVKSEAIVARAEDAVLKGVAIRAIDGTVIGFHMDVINPSLDKNLVVVVRDDIQSMCMIRLSNSDGREVTLFPEKLTTHNDLRQKKYDFGVILPQASYSWFVPVPAEIADDTGKPAPMRKGHYTASITFHTPYYLQNKGAVALAERPEYRSLVLNGSSIGIDVDPKTLANANILMRYMKGVLP